MSTKMGKRSNSLIIAQANFPLYFVSMVGDRNILVAGGGGQANTGVPNAIVCLIMLKI